MQTIKEDLKTYKLSVLGAFKGVFLLSTFWLVFLYRVAHWSLEKKIPILPGLLRTLGIIFYSADISPAAQIGQKFRIVHSVGIVIGNDVKIGNNFELFHNVTLGGRNQNNNEQTMPIIGDNVTAFSGSNILGPIIIGDNSSIGAGAVVTKSFESNSIIAGVPAKKIGTVVIAHAIESLNN
ncbi:serine O-acetyltransferase [Paenisporosarcina indica]|uniref:serine O-acetyltransferase n=1 Tax=Paenisporosarcina indica TaxID=650093 RepID=UPI00094FE7F7|nr:hypothetical protein [Paenisporosarcina indica]